MWSIRFSIFENIVDSHEEFIEPVPVFRCFDRGHGRFVDTSEIRPHALPFVSIASYPVKGLLEGMTPLLPLHTAAVVLGGFALVVIFWRMGLKAYASASS